jgi:hypothetical protein
VITETLQRVTAKDAPAGSAARAAAVAAGVPEAVAYDGLRRHPVAA